MTLNCFGHDPHTTYIVDIESDDLSAKYDCNTRVYLVGVMNVASGEYNLHRSVDDFLAGGTLGCTYIMHNASFDVPALRLRGVDVRNYYCTMVGSHTLCPQSSEYHSLGELQPDVKKSLRDILTEEGYNFTGIKKGEEYRWYRGDDSRLDTLVEEYLVRDLSATRNEYLRQVQEYELPTAKKLLEVLLTINIPYIERIIDMEQGVRITYDDSVANVLSEATERSMKACLSIAGYVGNPDPFPAGRVPFTGAGFKAQGNFCKMEPFNPNSGKQVALKLTELYGWQPTVLTQSGQPSTSSEVLEALDYPLCEHLLEHSKATKLQSFVGSLKECDGWVRPSYNQCATRTTRLSSSQP